MAGRKVVRPIAIVRVALLFLLVGFAAYAVFFADWRPRSLDDVQEGFSQAGPLAPYLAIGIQFVAVILFVPGFLLVLATALVFGRDSIWISLVGQTLGAAACFFLARFLGRDFLRSLLGPRVVHIERILEEHGLRYLIYMRFLGVVPLPLLSYGPGLVDVRFRVFLAATLIGESPLIIVMGLFGSSLAQIRGTSDVWDFQFLFPAILLATLYVVPTAALVVHRRLQRRKALAAGRAIVAGEPEDTGRL